MKVQILSRKLIAPSFPTAHHFRSSNISYFDQLFPSTYYVPCIFYYPASYEEQVVSNEEKSKRLQKALSENLTVFYPLAGRYNEENLLIDCNDKGAEYLEANVSGYLSQLLKEGELESELRNHLAPSILQPDSSPLVIVQFNMFECGGLAIAISVAHKIADGFTFFTFIGALATACQIGDENVHSPSFQLASFCPPRDLSAMKTSVPWTVGDKKIVEKRFVFNGEALSNLKADAKANGCGSKFPEHQPTRVEVVTALIWRGLIMVSEARHGYLRPSLLTHAVNLRGRTILQIPEKSCGNFTGIGIAQFNPMPDDESNVQFHHLVYLVHDGVSNKISECEKASTGDELFFTVTNSIRQICEAFEKGGVDVYMFVSWCHFSMYEADFGWGKPTWVSNVHIPREGVLLLDTKDGDGIEAWIGLDENSMLLFQQNPDIIAFTRQQL